MAESILTVWMLVPIESIKELRSGFEGRYYREQFKLKADCEDRWITIIYILDGTYKTLHLIAETKEVFQMWDATLRKLYDIRRGLTTGLGNTELRQAVWEKQYWKGADQTSDQKLAFDEVEGLCRRLNVDMPTPKLLELFEVSFVVSCRRNSHVIDRLASRCAEACLSGFCRLPALCQSVEETS